MKTLIITDGHEVGYAKPILWVEEGNTRTKIASFKNKEAVDMFMDWAEESGLIYKKCEF